MAVTEPKDEGEVESAAQVFFAIKHNFQKIKKEAQCFRTDYEEYLKEDNLVEEYLYLKHLGPENFLLTDEPIATWRNNKVLKIIKKVDDIYNNICKTYEDLINHANLWLQGLKESLNKFITKQVGLNLTNDEIIVQLNYLLISLNDICQEVLLITEITEIIEIIIKNKLLEDMIVLVLDVYTNVLSYKRSILIKDLCSDEQAEIDKITSYYKNTLTEFEPIKETFEMVLAAQEIDKKKYLLSYLKEAFCPCVEKEINADIKHSASVPILPSQVIPPQLDVRSKFEGDADFPESTYKLTFP